VDAKDTMQDDWRRSTLSGPHAPTASARPLPQPAPARRRATTERNARWAATGAGAALVCIVALILGFVAKESLPLLTRMDVWRFLTGQRWLPVSDPPVFEILPFIVSSGFITVTAMAIAMPVGLAAAVFTAEMAVPRIRLIAKPMLEILAGIPSIIYGLIGLMVVAPFVRRALSLPTGLNGLTASLLLAVMVLPIIVSLADEALQAVPRDYRDASLALGASEWQTLTRVTIPAANSGIKSALLLALGRTLGETMLVLMVAGGRVIVPTGITQPMRTITATLATEVNNAAWGSDHYRALFGLGFVLLITTLLISVAAERYAERGRRQAGLGGGGGAGRRPNGRDSRRLFGVEPRRVFGPRRIPAEGEGGAHHV
jgi:phosphate transport system permease protein